jgi:chromosome segregation ATPase
MLDVWRAGQVQIPEAPITLPAPLQRVLADYLAQLVAEGKVELSADLAEQQQVNTDLSMENERLISQIDALQAELTACQSERDSLAGRAQQQNSDLQLARSDAEQERMAAAGVRTDLAKALLRLEALPRLEEELTTARAEAAKERADRVAAEQAAAVATARLEGEEKARQHIETELRTVSTREEQANGQIKELTAQLVDGRLVRARSERELRRPVDLRRGAGPVSAERKMPAGQQKGARDKQPPPDKG